MTGAWRDASQGTFKSPLGLHVCSLFSVIKPNYVFSERDDNDEDRSIEQEQGRQLVQWCDLNANSTQLP